MQVQDECYSGIWSIDSWIPSDLPKTIIFTRFLKLSYSNATQAK